MLEMQEQLADLDAAREFHRAVATRMARDRQAELIVSVEERGRFVNQLLEKGLDRHGLGDLLSSFFGIRRRRTAILGAFSDEELCGCVNRLGQGDVSALGELDALDQSGEFSLKEFGREFLHAARPFEYALWTHWVFDPDAETGALLLVLSEGADLYGSDEFETYQRVNDASRFLLHTLSAIDVGVSLERPFSLDVFLAGVYAVYAETILQMRMTKEFNKLLPDMSELIERLLGVRWKGEIDANRR